MTQRGRAATDEEMVYGHKPEAPAKGRLAFAGHEPEAPAKGTRLLFFPAQYSFSFRVQSSEFAVLCR